MDAELDLDTFVADVLDFAAKNETLFRAEMTERGYSEDDIREAAAILYERAGRGSTW